MFKNGVAVTGLPENCYNPNWLNTLDQFEREDLQVKPPYNMKFLEEEQRQVFFLSSVQVYSHINPNDYHYRVAANFIPLANGKA